AGSAARSGSVPLSTRDAGPHWEPRGLLWHAPGRSLDETGSAVWPSRHAHTHGATGAGIPASASLLLAGEWLDRVRLHPDTTALPGCVVAVDSCTSLCGHARWRCREPPVLFDENVAPIC